MTCALEGEALCGSASDMAVLNTSQFAKDLVRAGAKAYGDSSGSQAIEEVIGAGRLSAACLACQGASLDCSVQQRSCFSLCGDKCAKSCKTCVHQHCDVSKACGGVPGVTVQMPLICANPDNADELTASVDILEIEFIGTCKRMNCTNQTECMSTHLSGTHRSSESLAILWAAAALFLAASV